MPVAQQDYAQLKALFNTSPLLQCTSIDFETESGIQPVQVMGEGLAGFTSGTGMCTVNIGFVVPIGGLEFDFQGICAREEYCSVQLFVGRQNYTGTGKINNVKITGSNDQVTSGTFTWTGPKKPVE